ncbi:MAG: ATP-NAD kinase family protein [Methanobacteriota archaeon]
MKRIGFLINPVAGMGGRVGLKGTDGKADEARAAGAEPVAPHRGLLFLRQFRERQAADPRLQVRWLTCAGPMGASALEAAGAARSDLEIVHTPADRTTAADTRAWAANAAEAGAELLVFVGGDGTARDIVDAIGDRRPVVGVPSGVKMHSGVFALTPATAADLLAAYLRDELRTGDAELLDLDEDAYREGEWKVRFYGTARGLVEPNLVAAGKEILAEVSGEGVVSELREHFAELFETEPTTLFLLGPGSTIDAIARRFGLAKTLLGIDAVVGGRIVGADLNEKGILALLDRHPVAKIVVSPIGAQGFILGRGNLQLSPEVLRRIGPKRVIVVATPGKLTSTPILRVDTGDGALDEEFRTREYLFVLVGYRTTRLHPIKG